MKLQILSYNIHKGLRLGNQRNVLNQIREGIRQEEADLVFLQEVLGEHSHKKYHPKDWPNTAQFEYLADQTWSHYAYGKNAVYSEGHHGNAILSKYPILSHDNIDLSTNRFEKRGLLHGTIHIPEIEKKLHLLCVHLNLFEGGRRSQVGRILRRIEESIPKEDPFILAGDFNDWSGKTGKTVLERFQVKEAFLEQTGSLAKTFPALFPVLKLDRVYYRGLTLVETQLLEGNPWRLLSDHIPLKVTFEL